MNLHEYQGKEILNSFGVRIQRGIVADTPEAAVEAAKKLTEETGTGWHVIKATILVTQHWRIYSSMVSMC